MKRRWVWALALAALLAGGAWARCAGWRSVFPRPGEVELVPSDSHYYARFAQLQLRAFPRFTAFDPYVNFPEGARIYWPPLHTLLVAAAVAIGGAAGAGPERAAALVGPVLACLELAGVALLARRLLGRQAALRAAALLALIPITVESGALGNADHHVHEPFLLAATALATGHCLSRRSTRAAVLSGVLLGLGRLLTPAAFVLVPCLAAAFPLAAWLGRRRAETASLPRLALLAGTGCALSLLVGTLAFGLPGSLAYEHLSLFHPLFALALFLGAAALAGAVTGARRGWAWPLAPAALCGALVSGECLRALGHLGRADPLLAAIMESEPLARDPAWAARLFGAALLALPFCLVAAGRRVLRGRAPLALPALVSTVLLVAAAAMQARFAQALSGGAAAVIALGLPWTAPARSLRAARRVWQGVVVLATASFLPGLLPQPQRSPPPDVERVRPTLRWMREHTPSASAEPLAPEAPAYGVVASHLLGHFLTLWAERPAVATMFSQTETHRAGNARGAAVLAEVDDEKAYRLARETGARYVLVTPSEVVLGYPELDRARALLGRLLDHAGMESDGAPATAHFRLVYDSAEQRRSPARGSYARLFEVVPGALLRGQAPAGQEVTARLRLLTHRGEPLVYERRTAAGADGTFALRVAYPTDPGEGVRPVPGESGYRVWLGGQEKAVVAVTEAEVLGGATVELGGRATPRAEAPAP